MSFLEGMLFILGFIFGLCYVIVYFVFVFSNRLSRKRFRRLAFMLAFLSSMFSWLFSFFGDSWETADVSTNAFFIVGILVISAMVGGFAVLIGLYYEKSVRIGQSRLLEIMQRRAAREAEEKDKES